MAGKKTVCCVYSIEDLKEMALADAKSQLGVDGKYEVEADDYGENGASTGQSVRYLSGIRITVRRVQ